MRALSLTRPWPYCVLHLGKLIENRRDKRGMPPMCKFRGPVLLHAALSWDPDCWAFVCDMHDVSNHHVGWLTDDMRAKHRAGGIVGRCNVVGHIEPLKCEGCGGAGDFNGPASGELAPCAACAGRGTVPVRVVGNPDPRTTGERGVHSTDHIHANTLSEWEYARGLDLRWWMGGYALILADVEPLPFVACKGRLGLWRPERRVLEALGLGEAA